MNRDRSLLFLHIGDGKTGSTSLQAYLRRFRTHDPVTGFWYPFFDERTAYHNALKHAFTTAGSDPAAVFEEKFSLLETAPPGTIAHVSSEPLSKVAPQDLAAAIPTRFIDGPEWDIRVVSYLRPHVSHFLANYQQIAKTGRTTRSLDEFLGDVCASDNRRYAPRIAAHRAIWGDRYIARPFVRDRLQNKDVVTDYLALVRAETGRGPVLSTPPERRNTSLGAHELAATLYVSGLMSDDVIEKKRRRQLARFREEQIEPMQLPRSPLQVDARMLERLRAAFAEDAADLDAMLWPDAPVFGPALAAIDAADATTPNRLDAFFTPDQIATIKQAANAYL